MKYIDKCCDMATFVNWLQRWYIVPSYQVGIDKCLIQSFSYQVSIDMFNLEFGV
mgnify:FL=1